MPMTTVWRNATGDHSLGKTDIGAVADVFMALFTANPTAEGLVVSEVVGSGYGRVNITAKMSAFADGASSNTDEIDFGSPAADWGLITHIGIMPASSGGVMRYYEELPTPRNAPSGSRNVKFTIGTMTVRHE